MHIFAIFGYFFKNWAIFPQSSGHTGWESQFQSWQNIALLSAGKVKDANGKNV